MRQTCNGIEYWKLHFDEQPPTTVRLVVEEDLKLDITYTDFKSRQEDAVYIEERGKGVNDYRLLINKPQINSHTLIDNKTSEELDIHGDEVESITNAEIESAFRG